MVLSIILILILIAALMLYNYRNKYAMVFAGICISLNLIIFSTLMYIARISVYRPLFPLESGFLVVLMNLPIKFYDIKTIIAFAIAMLFVFLWLVVRIEGRSVFKGKYSFIWFLGLIPAIIFLLFNSYSFNLYLYVHIGQYADKSDFTFKFLKFIADSIFYYNCSVMVIYMISPFVFLIKGIVSSKIDYIKLQKVIIMICLLFMEVFFVMFFVTGPFSKIVMSNLSIYDIGYPVYSRSVYMTIPVVILVIFDLIYWMLIHFKVIYGMDFFKKGFIIKKCHLLSSDMRHVFHAQKSMVFAIKLQAKEILNDESRGNAVKNAGKIVEEADMLMEKFTAFSSLFKQTATSASGVDLRKVIFDAVSSMDLCKGIEYEISDFKIPMYVYGDYGHLKEVFKNIFANSCEAIKRSERADSGKISVTYAVEEGWTYVCVKDNGEGISKKNIKRVFAPLYTTKNNVNNWGIGLAYVKKVICAHNGLIFIDGAVNKFCRVKILLPVYRGK